MLVYRVEKDHGTHTIGPYQGYYDNETVRTLAYALEAAHNNDAHPMPKDDGFGENFNTHLIFGFIDKKQTEEWFAGFGKDLENAGFRISVYNVPEEDVAIGGRQVAFFPYRATRLKDHLVTSIIK